MIFEAQKPLHTLVAQDIERRLQQTGEVSEAHGESHIVNVATISGFVGDIYGYSEREKELAASCGLLHDLIRTSTEDPSVKDELASAKRAVEALRFFSDSGVYETTEDERNAIGHAIEHHGAAPYWLKDEKTRELTPESLADKLHFALFVADKIEANGVRVIARRSSFVAGDRLRGEHGDWKAFGFTPDKDELVVVAIESLIRLSFINPEELYPNTLRSLVQPLYEIQREFVSGVLASIHFSIEDIARLLIKSKDTSGRSILQVRNIIASDETHALADILKEKSGITNDHINGISTDISQSAREAIDYFSQRYTENLDSLIEEWRPSGQKAKEWHQSMIEYTNGTWLHKQVRGIKK